MGKCMIIGCGGVASVAIHKCCQNSDVFEEILIASRTLSKCEALKAKLSGGKTKIRTAQVNADHVDELIALIRDFQPDVVLNLALPYQDLTIMDACLATKTNYVDTANYEPPETAKFEYSWQWAYREKFREAGICALLGSGFDPGVTGVFSAYAQKHQFDEIHFLDILDANGGDHGYPFATNFNPEINIREVTAKGSYWENGHWVETEPMEIKREYDFAQIGKKDMYLLHHEELESLGQNLKGIRRIRFFMTFGQSYLNHLKCLQDVGMTSIEPIDFEGQKIVPLQFLKAVLPDPASLGPRTIGKTNIGCIFQGVKDGKPKTYALYNVCDHQACYREVGSQAISYTTGVPAMIGAMLVMTGVWNKPGVWNMEQFDPDPFMEALNRWGLPWTEDFAPALVDWMDTAELLGLPTPRYVVDESQLVRNPQILRSVSDQSGCKILLAQKAFSFYAAYPLIGRYLAGTEASGLYEARLGKTEMGGETHVFSAAYREDEFAEIASLCDHIVFNSFTQWEKYRETALAAGSSCGIRINPECSTQNHALYDPCAPYSRLGVTKENFRPDLLEGIEGLHFHTLCEQGCDALTDTLAAVEEKFGAYIPRMKWVNFGGGHHITKPGYDLSALVERILAFRQKYGVTVYLEPGEAVALNAGVLVTRVLDVVQNGMDIAVLDASAACHMPDVLEMPYRPPLRGTGMPGEKPYLYRLAGPTCLAGDVIGDYSFDRPLQPGDTLVFEDMAIYTMVKNNTFNGVRLPGIYLRETGGTIRTIRTFGYGDFKNRLS